MPSFQTAAGVLGGLLVVGALLPGLARRSMLSLAALVVFCSVILHGLTDTAGTNWIAQRDAREGAVA